MSDIDAALSANRGAVSELVAVTDRSPARWTTPPAPGKWSPSQIVEHLARSLEESAHVVSGAPSKFPALPGFLRPVIRTLFFKRVLRTGVFPRAKARKAFDPDMGSPTAAAGRARLETANAGFEQACRARAASGQPVDHTVFGRVSVEDYVRFMELHTRHHRKQIAALVMAFIIGAIAFVRAQAPPQASPRTPAAALSIASLKDDLVVADRILFDQGFLDTAGHVSVRIAPDRFLMPWRRAPELIVADDVMEYDLNGNAADARNRPLILERFIHSEIYRARPDVRAIVHGHTPSLVMFSSSNIPLRPLFAGAAFIGDGVPAFKNGDAGGGVQSAELGRRLAETMGKAGAVLIRGHGVVVAAPSLVALVQRAISLDTNAKLVSRLLAMGDKEPMYIHPAPAADAADAQGSPGGDNSREWEAYKRRAEALRK